MTKFLGLYRGAAVYEIDNFMPSSGKKVSVKLIAKAMHPKQKNMGIDFIQEEKNQSLALKKIKAKIDFYLNRHDIEEFVIDLF